MTIYCEVWHVPYQHNLAMAFPEHTFLTPTWSTLREQPSNVEVVDDDQLRDRQLDVVIDSNRSFHHFARPCKLRVKLLHMERGANTPDDERHIRECLKRSDAVVSVSEHKKFSFMKEAQHWKFVVIPFGVAIVQIGKPVPGLVGTTYSDMCDQQGRVWEHILKHFPDAELTGFRNPFPCVSPQSYREFNERFERMDVFVHTVVGNSVGLSFAEAMMRGIPVVTGMNTDLPKELVEGYNCMITRGHAYHCLDEMVEAVKWITSDRMRRCRMGIAARETAKKIYGLDKFRTRWNHVFNNRLSHLI